MDGTLTPARMPIDDKMIDAIVELSNCADIGIVSGSPIEYIAQQCQKLFLDPRISPDKIKIMPCNGTKEYEFLRHVEPEMVLKSEVSMRETIGQSVYKEIVVACSLAHKKYMTGNNPIEFPLSGNFISYRGSLLNFCPPGRDATDEDRKKFAIVDKKYNIRKSLLKNIRDYLKEKNIKRISCALGGNTSIDIYPTGWDKTYCLRHLKNYSYISFVGDRCDKNGNDKTLYDALHPNSYKTKGPESTLKIIDELIVADKMP